MTREIYGRGPSADEGREMCFTRLAENTERKNRHFDIIAELSRAVSSQLRHLSTIGKKLVKHGGSLSNTKSPGSWPSSIPSDILIHAAIWPQLIWAENWDP